MRRTIALICGIIAVLLGGLWLLQGLGLVHVRPILCFADCAPVQGPSLTWAIVGAIALAVGGFGVFWSRKSPVGSPLPPKPGSK
jgi:hypothetical protein